MKNRNEILKTDAKHKMLFNSDGFEFLIKFVTGLFTIIGAVLLVMLKIIGTLCASSSKSNENNDHIDNYVSLDPLKTEGENKVDGTGYYK